jgi:transcriptional regulator with XRE-family HTH domain
MIKPEKIKALRENKGLSQERLAEKLGVNRSMVAKWEGGVCGMSTDTMVNVCAILDTTPNDLMGYVQKGSDVLDRNLLALMTEEVKELKAERKELRAQLAALKQDVLH